LRAATGPPPTTTAAVARSLRKTGRYSMALRLYRSARRGLN
jgi:hypothetical protein